MFVVVGFVFNGGRGYNKLYSFDITKLIVVCTLFQYVINYNM